MILDDFRLDGRVAIVTGGGQGIGRGIAIGLAEAGADVVIGARTESDLEEVASVVRATGRRCVPVVSDVLVEEDHLGSPGLVTVTVAAEITDTTSVLASRLLEEVRPAGVRVVHNLLSHTTPLPILASWPITMRC